MSIHAPKSIRGSLVLGLGETPPQKASQQLPDKPDPSHQPAQRTTGFNGMHRARRLLLVLLLGLIGVAVSVRWWNASDTQVANDEDSGLPQLSASTFITWKAVEDPPRERPRIAAKDVLATDVQTIVAGGWPHPFLVTHAAGDKYTLQVWDLRTGSKLGQIQAELSIKRHVAISPDGRLLACPDRSQAAVYSTETGEQITSVEIQGAPTVDRVYFIGDDRLLAVHSGRRFLWNLVDLNKDNLEIDVECLDEIPTIQLHTVAFSPSARYLAVITEANTLMVADILQDSIVGNVELPPEAGLMCQQLAFSQGGDRLSCVFGYSSGHLRVLTFDLSTERQPDDCVINIDRLNLSMSNSDQTPPIQWLSDDSCWLLFGRYIIDSESKQVLLMPFGEDLPAPETGIRSVRAFDGELVHVLGDQLCRQAVSSDLLHRIQQAISLGGSPADLDLPKVSEFNSSARTVSGGWGNWRMSDDSKRTKPNHKSLPISRSDVNSANFGGQGSNEIVLFRRHIALGYQSDSHSVIRYDCTSGEQKSICELSRMAQVESFDGASDALLTLDTHLLRLDIWSTDGRHKIGWRPYAHQESDRARSTIWAALIGGDEVLSLSGGGELVKWSTVQRRAIYRRTVSPAGNPALDLARRRLALFDGSVIRFIDTTNGKDLGRIETEAAEMIGGSFRADNLAFAAVMKKSESQSLFCLVCDLTDGQVKGRFDVLNSSQSPTWMGDNHVMIGNRIYHAEQGTHLWTLDYPGIAVLGDWGGQIWFLGQNRVAPVQPSEMPLLSSLNRANSKEMNTVVHPGTSVAVKIDVPGEMFSPSGSAREAVANELLEMALRRHGFRVDPQGELILRFSIEELPTGKSVWYGSGNRFRRSGGFPVSEVNLNCRLELLLNEESVWKREFVEEMPPSVLIVRERKDLANRREINWEEEVQSFHYKSVVKKLREIEIPSHLIRYNDEFIQIPGHSRSPQDVGL